MIHTNAKIITIDIETSPITISHKTYELKNNVRYFNPLEISQDWVILGAAWKELDKEPRCISVSSKNVINDEAVVRKLHDVISSADIIVGHNVDSFDIKKINSRFIKYSLPVIDKKPTVDTLKIAKKYFKFSSNKLFYVAKLLGVEDKGNSPDWTAILSGEQTALSYMREYNKQDVVTTEQVYKKLLPYIENHPNMNLFIPKDVLGNPVLEYVCPNCGSDDTSKNGKRYRFSGVYQRFYCNSCGKPFCGKTNMAKVIVK